MKNTHKIEKELFK